MKALCYIELLGLHGLGGFIGIGFPEELAIALEKRFLQSGQPSSWELPFMALMQRFHIIYSPLEL